MVVIADSLAIENPASARRKTLNWPCGGQRAPMWSECWAEGRGREAVVPVLLDVYEITYTLSTMVSTLRSECSRR